MTSHRRHKLTEAVWVQLHVIVEEPDQIGTSRRLEADIQGRRNA